MQFVTETYTVYAYLLMILKAVAPVGGFIESVNKLVLLVSWLAVIGAVACIGTVVMIVKKRRP